MNGSQTLEERLAQAIQAGMKVSAELAMLIASGVESKDAVMEYSGKIGQLQQGFHEYLNKKGQQPNSLPQKARTLFDYLWDGMPKRNHETACYRLTDAIDAQLSWGKETVVGNCLSLTALFTVLLEREEGFGPLSVLALPTHVMSRLNYGTSALNIEQTRSDGFNNTNPFQNGHNVEEPLYLASAMISSRAQERLKKRDIPGAIKDCNTAVKISQHNANAYYFRGLAYELQDNLQAAHRDAKIALRLFPNYADPQRLIDIINNRDRKLPRLNL